MGKRSRAEAKSSSLGAKKASTEQRVVNSENRLAEINRKKEAQIRKADRLEKKQQRIEKTKQRVEARASAVENKKLWREHVKQRAEGRKVQLEQVLALAQEGGNAERIAAVTKRLEKVNRAVSKNTSAVNNLSVLKTSLDTQISEKEGVLVVCDFGRTQAGEVACDLYKKSEELTRKVLKEQDRYDRLHDKKKEADTIIEKIDRNKDGCICPTVYSPVVVNGVTYGNSCLAACAGAIAPPNPPRPPKPPIGDRDRVCLQVITCGSDGNTYPDSCLPAGVYPVRNGGSCEDINYSDIKDPVFGGKRPPVQVSTGRILPVKTPAGAPMPVCGTDRITYPSIEQLPQGVFLKSLGTCSRVEV